MTELRVYLPIEDLQPQFAAWLSSPTRARAYPPFRGQNSLIIEVTPALAIHRVTDLALKVAPDLEPGILFTERQFGLLELHANDMADLDVAGKAILKATQPTRHPTIDPPVLQLLREQRCGGRSGCHTRRRVGGGWWDSSIRRCRCYGHGGRHRPIG